jgi:hypothetical protein
LDKTRVGLIASVLVATVAVSPLALAGLADRGVELPGAAPAQKLLSLLDARSPGERTEGALTKSKKKTLGSVAPRQRALGKVVTPSTAPKEEQLAKVITPATPSELIPVVPAPTFAEVLAPLPKGFVPGSGTFTLAPVGGGGGVGSPGGGGGGPGGGGGGPGGGGVVPPSNPENPVIPPAVPEPGTWAMMLIGFGMIGFSVRRRRPGATAQPGSLRA